MKMAGKFVLHMGCYESLSKAHDSGNRIYISRRLVTSVQQLSLAAGQSRHLFVEPLTLGFT
jgi:hypothetical protein